MKTFGKSIVAALAVAAGLNTWADSSTCTVKAVPSTGGGVWVTKSTMATPDDGDYKASDSSTYEFTTDFFSSWKFYGYYKEISGVSEFLYWSNSETGGKDYDVESTKKWTWVGCSVPRNGSKTIYAHFHVHDKQYVANGLTIEHKCVNTATTCKNSCGSSSATLVAADSKAYNGVAYAASVQGDSAATLAYYMADDAANAMPVTPVEAGSYKVVMTYGDKSVEKKFIITHVHDWTQDDPADGKVTWTCSKSGCTIDAPSVTLLAADKVYDGNAVAFETAKSADFDAHVPGVTIGDVKYFKADGETGIAAPKYTGSYVAKVAVGDKTIVVPFAITKPAGGYTDGWEVNNTATSVRYDTWPEALTNATDGGTVVYYRDGDRDFETQDFSVGGKNITIDFNGKTLTKSAWTTLTIVNEGGTGVLTFQNVVIDQPRGIASSGQIETKGNIVFGTGVVVNNTATSPNNYCTITSKSGTLEVADGLYQSGFVADGGSVVISGGKFWSYDRPANAILAPNRDVREIGGDYIYEVFGHTHSFKYVASGNVITLVCEGDDAEDCSYTADPQKLTLTADDAVWTGKAYAGASFTTDENFTAGGAVVGEIEFYDGETKLGGAPTTMGCFKAKISITVGVDTLTAVKTFAVGHDHGWKYTAAGDTITLVCTNATACDFAQNPRKATLKASNVTYTGAKQTPATIEKDADFEGTPAISYDRDPIAVGTYTAYAKIGGATATKTFKITTADIAGATTELEESVNYDFNEQTNDLGTVKFGNLTLVKGVDYTIAESSELTGIGNGKTDTTFTVVINGKGNYAGSTKTLTWTVKAPETALEDNKATDGGTLDGTTLKMEEGKNYGWKYYAAENAPDGSGIAGFYAGIKIAWPNTTRWTDLDHAFFKVNGGDWVDGHAVKAGEVAGLMCDAVDLNAGQKSLFSYLKSVTWYERLTLEDLRAAKESGAEAVTNVMTAIGLVWGKEVVVWYGDKKGVKETDFAITTKMDGLELYDNDGFKVWPEHAHEWKWTVSGNVLTAVCEYAGCQYEKNAQVMTIDPEVAEKYCDTKPVTATVTGAEALVEATEATVGDVEYWQGETKLAGAPADPGEYAAKCTVVSKDLAATNTIEAAFSILTGQAIWNGVHVADAATYLEMKTQDNMDIFVGKDFTASKTFVVPASWKAETLTEVDMTIRQFIDAVKAGAFGDLYTWDDVLDLIAGRVTAQELFKRLQDTTKQYTLLDCGAKTFNLNGFTVTAAEGVPFLRNEGTLTLLGEGTMTTNGCETLLVNVGTLAIEGGKYVGSITNEGALVVSGGYFTGTISNAGDGTVVLTGGAYEIKPNKNFVPRGYDLVRRGGIYYVEKHEHKYTFLPVGNCLMSCTCWNWFVDDPDQIIQFSNCGAHKLGIFIGTRDNLTGMLPKKTFADEGKPVAANIVGYNYSALLRIGLLKNADELVAIAKEAIEAEENWDEMTVIDQVKTMMSIVTSIKDLDIDVSDLVWDQAQIEEETGLKFGEIKYYDAKTDEELAGAPSKPGLYRARVVITTPKGNDVTRSWKYSIGVDYESDLEAWLDDEKTAIKDGWNKFRETIRETFERPPTEEEIRNYFDELDQKHREYFQNLTNEYADIDQKAIDAHQKMIDDLKDAHEKVKNWAKNAAEEIKDLYERHEETYLEEAHEAAKEAWYNFREDMGDLTEQDAKDFFDNLDEEIRQWFEERKANHQPVDEAIVAAHGKMVEELKIVHSSIVKWVNKTFDRAEKSANEVAPAPLMVMAVQEEEKTGWGKFKDDVKSALNRLPTKEEVEDFFAAEGKRHAQFVEDLKADHKLVDDAIVAAHDKMVAELKAKHEKAKTWAKDTAKKIKDLYERHEDTYLEEAHEAVKKAWENFRKDVDNACETDVKDFCDHLDEEIRQWFEDLKEIHKPVDEAIIAAHDKMVEELKEFLESLCKKNEKPYIVEEEGTVVVDEASKTVEVKPEDGTTVIEVFNPSDYTIQVPPTIEEVKGVDPTNIEVLADATNGTQTVKVDITDAFDITDNGDKGAIIELNSNAVVKVEIAGKEPETIPVVPELTESTDVVKPFTMSEDKVAAGVKTIPGLTYNLLSGDTVTKIDKVVKTIVAADTRVVLEAAKTADPAKFYKIQVAK